MKEIPFTKYKLFLVEWVDAEGDTEWSTENKVLTWANEDCIIYEVGWIVAETDKYIILMSQISYDGDIGNRTKIPKAWVKKKKQISEKTGG